MNNKDDLLSPVKNYTPPSLPTLAEAGTAPLLKALPSRWKKNAAVMACLGFAGMLSLSGCTGAIDEPFYITQPIENENDVHARYYYNDETKPPYYTVHLTEQEILAQITAQIEEAKLDLRIHWGGSGAGPFYIAHITEQEAQGFIRARLEAAGLNLGAAPPGYTIFNPDDMTPRPGLVEEKGIDLFDADNRVAIVNISWEDSERPFTPTGSQLADIVAEEFTSQVSGIFFGVFHNPGHMVSEGSVYWEDDEMRIEMDDVTPEDKDVARYILIQRLTAQVDDFIARLRAEGII